MARVNERGRSFVSLPSVQHFRAVRGVPMRDPGRRHRPDGDRRAPAILKVGGVASAVDDRAFPAGASNRPVCAPVGHDGLNAPPRIQTRVGIPDFHQR
jgi:hypothetical protein